MNCKHYGSSKYTNIHKMVDKVKSNAEKALWKVEALKAPQIFYRLLEGFPKVLQKKRHYMGKKHMLGIESDNSNTRHRLGRLTRKTKAVS